MPRNFDLASLATQFMAADEQTAAAVISTQEFAELVTSQLFFALKQALP
jgi:hypothetical protein